MEMSLIIVNILYIQEKKVKVKIKILGVKNEKIKCDTCL